MQIARVIATTFALFTFTVLTLGQQPTIPGNQERGVQGPGTPAFRGRFRRNPRRPGRLNVLAWADVRNGFQHDSISHAISTIEELGYKSGLWDTYIRTDSQLIRKTGPFGSDGQPVYGHNLNDFDAILFFGVREIDLTAQQRADLLSFVHDDGKGLVIVHSGATAFMSWPEFGDMIGGRFDNHPWNIVTAPIIVEEPDSPIVHHIKSGASWTDEMYQMKDFDRTKDDVLLRLDVSNLDMSKPGVHRKDGDFPLAWIKTYGKGRVFLCTLGHDITAWDNPDLQKIYVEGVKWALGLSKEDVHPHAMQGGPAQTRSQPAGNSGPKTKTTGDAGQ